jgi:hypothetical protein
VLDLLAARPAGGPVPLLVPLASWNAHEQSLHGWLEQRLLVDYPGLAVPVPDGAGTSRARALLDKGLVLAVLDGLDEIGDEVRGRAIDRINSALRPGQRVVVTARTAAYQAAVSPASGPEVRLVGAAGIHLSPLDAAEVANYLRGSAGGPAAAARWDAVLAAGPSPVAQALTTPLMTSLARVIYNPRPNEQLAAVGLSPAELLDPVRFPSRAAVEQHLFDGFLRAAYRRHPDPAQRCRWDASDAERWLVFLARHLEHTLHGSPDLAWWQLPQAIPSWRRRLVLAVAGGLTAGLLIGLVGGLNTGTVCGLLIALAVARGGEGRLPQRTGRWRLPSQPRAWVVLVVVLATGVWFGVIAGLAYGLSRGLVIGLVTVAVFMLSAGESTMPANLTEAANPISVLRQDRGAFLSDAFRFGFRVGLLCGLAGWLVVGRADGLAVGLTIGLTFGLAAGLVAGLQQTPWGMFVLARAWLARRNRVPAELMAFLADAHEKRGVLRQVGAVYQFRHLELQRRLGKR